MVQDLRVINEAVVPLHPTVPNPYVILGEIPPSAKWFTVLYLKDAFFCIPLAKESQYLFAFEWEAPGEKCQQMTWIVLPQGFRDSPHLFGQALSRDLLDLDMGPNGKILQYIDLMWGTPQKKAEATLKQALTRAPALRLPDPEKAFQLYVHERQGIALGVLTQRLGSEHQPVAYLSKKLDPTYPRLAPLPLKSLQS